MIELKIFLLRVFHGSGTFFSRCAAHSGLILTRQASNRHPGRCAKRRCGMALWKRNRFFGQSKPVERECEAGEALPDSKVSLCYRKSRYPKTRPRTGPRGRLGLQRSWFLFWRVWFWLRTNAGSVDEACKSNGWRPVAILAVDSGGRASNTRASYPPVWDNGWKRPLIPGTNRHSHECLLRGRDLRTGRRGRRSCAIS